MAQWHANFQVFWEAQKRHEDVDARAHTHKRSHVEPTLLIIRLARTSGHILYRTPRDSRRGVHRSLATLEMAFPPLYSSSGETRKRKYCAARSSWASICHASGARSFLRTRSRKSHQKKEDYGKRIKRKRRRPRRNSRGNHASEKKKIN